MNKNQKGFGHLVIIFTVLIVGSISASGYMVYKSHNKKPIGNTASTVTKSTTSVSSGAQKQTVDPTAAWTSYSNAKGEFSLKHPSSWIMPENIGYCSEDIVLFGLDSESAGRCASESVSQVMVSSNAGIFSGSELESDLYANITNETVTVDGISGRKQTATALDTSNGRILVGGVPDGTKAIVYTFQANSKYYIAQYMQKPGYQDISSDFNLMVTKTLKFSIQ